MKNNRIIDSWNKRNPDSAADERMLSAILSQNHSRQSKRKNVNILNWKLSVPIVACLVLFVVLAGVFGNNAGWFGSKVYTVELNDGTLNFYKSDNMSTAIMDMSFCGLTLSRALTSDESRLLFGDLSVTAHGEFKVADGRLLHVEGDNGKLFNGNLKIIAASPCVPTTDTIIKGIENMSEINGVEVSAGYWITSANSKGIKNIIFYTNFTVYDIKFYVECAGDLGESDTLKAEMASAIDTLTKNKSNKFSTITFTNY